MGRTKSTTPAPEPLEGHDFDEDVTDAEVDAADFDAEETDEEGTE